MFTITLVRIGDKLVGKTVSDRFNLSQMGVYSINGDRNLVHKKAIQREFDREFGKGVFTLKIERNGKLHQFPTAKEATSLGDFALSMSAPNHSAMPPIKYVA